MVKNSIKVFGRIKLCKKARRLQNYNIRKVRDFNELILCPEMTGDYGYAKNSRQKYRFCEIFDQPSTQAHIFETVAKPVVNSVLQGYNGTIFAYGQTGSGKTYSMTGSAEYENRGIIPRTIQHIFEHIQKSPNVLYSIYISYLEIYNEVGYDLLNPKHRASYLEDLPRVTLLEDAKGQTHLRNLGVISVGSEREAMCLLFMGDTNRTIAETPMNLYSSRSHCVFTVHVAATLPEDGRVRRSKLHLVDLAGSERVHKSSISGTLLVDAKQINLSLHYLEQVIIALSDAKRAHVPYRNSLMTSVLKDSLGGNCLTAMLATLSVEPSNFEETISTCKFAQRVAMVSSEVFINEEEDPDLKISELKLEIEKLRKELLVYKNLNGKTQKLPENINLTPEVMQECEQEVSMFIKGSTHIFPLSDNVNKISAYFTIFKKIITNQSALIKENQTKNQNQRESYEECVKEKTNEISLLVNMVNKLKEESKCVSAKTSSLVNKAPSATTSQTIFAPKQLTEKQAFEMFLKSEENNVEVSKCTKALKSKIETAKNASGRIKFCKNNIVMLKRKLRENINQSPDLTNKLMGKLKSQQEIYRENILELHDLKNETSHLQHSLQRAYVQLKQRFKDWWARETGQTFDKPSFTHIPLADLFRKPRSNSNTSLTRNIANYPSIISETHIPILPNFSIDSFPPLYEKETSDYLKQFPGLIAETYAFGDTANYEEIQDEPVSYEAATLPKFNIPDDLPPFQSIPNSASLRCSSSTKLAELPDYHPQSPGSYTYSEGIGNSYESSPRDNDDQYITRLQMQDREAVPAPTNYLNYMNYNVPEKLVSHSRPPSVCSKSEKSNNVTTYYKSDSPRVLRPSTSSSECYYESSNSCNNPYETKVLEKSCHYTPVSSSPKSRPQSCDYTSSFETLADNGDIEQSCIENSHNPDQFLQSVPLTGDPDVDDEILSFYRTKQNLRLFK